MTDALLISLVQAVQFFITAYTWVIIITALISWVNPDPYNPIVLILYKLSAPAYKLVSKIPTRIGNIDLAPLIIVFALWFINNLLSNLIIEGLR